MILNSEQAEERLNSPKNLANRFSGNKLVQIPESNSNSPNNSGTISESPTLSNTTIPDSNSNSTKTVNSPAIEAHSKVIPIIEHRGRSKGALEIPVAVKTDIAVRARAGERGTALAREYSVSPSAVSNAKTGRTKVDEQAVEDKLSEINDLALMKVMATLGLITDTKLKELTAKDLSIVGMNLAKVHSNLTHKEASQTEVNVMVYAPETRKEDVFKCVEI